MYDKLAAQANAIDTNGFVSKTQYNTDKSNLQKKLMTLIKKYPILVDFFKKQIIMLKSLR